MIAILNKYLFDCCSRSGPSYLWKVKIIRSDLFLLNIPLFIYIFMIHTPAKSEGESKGNFNRF